MSKKATLKQRRFGQKLLDFYLNEFEFIIKVTDRGPLISQILIVFGTIQRMTSMFTTTIMNVISITWQNQTSDVLMVYIRMTLNYLKIYPMLNSALPFQNETEIFLILSSFINFLIFLYVFLRLWAFLYYYDCMNNNKKDKYQEQNIQKSALLQSSINSLENNQKASNLQKSSIPLKYAQYFALDKLVSGTCQICLHTLLMPSLDISFSFIIGSSQNFYLNKNFIDVLAILNLVLTCIVGLVLSKNGSDYNVYLSDYMIKRDSIANTLLLMQDITFQILYNTTQVTVVIVVHIICLLVRLLQYCQELPYFYDHV
ncbi:hypothetical protein ABPG72_015134 [Tetrahymena utriculariae]